MSLENYWNEALKKVSTTMDAGKAMWLDFINYSGEDGDTLLLSCDAEMYRENFNTECKKDIQKALDTIANKHIEIDLSVNEEDKKPEKKSIKKEAPTRKTNSYLNKNYTFDNFIPCENTNFAYTAAKAIAINPGSSYNPCLIYGGVGLGKTHLLESIGNYIEEKTPQKNVIYVTAESFTNDYINSLAGKKISDFRIKYRKADVLLIDDIHFLDEKISTQEELFHTFNDLYEKGHQIIFTCDRPVSELPNFTDRLKSRFTRGINLSLTAPDYETRVAILKKKCEEKNTYISDSVINYIAENVKTNVRDLEGSLTTLIAYTNLLQTDITLDIAKDQLKHLISAPTASEQDISLVDITKVVASYYNVEPTQIRSKSRTAIIKDSRNVAIFLSRKITQYSTTEIGNFFNRDHSTITHSIDLIEKEKKTNSDLAANLDEIEAKIKAKAK
ncbi:MAG: chromosomal replication initiator protein DnaA [Sphaerochaetaceae bacterium]|nr:chromosomal replication initiator protein DnaA [Sphaerochaetaceae bacterium]